MVKLPAKPFAVGFVRAKIILASGKEFPRGARVMAASFKGRNYPELFGYNFLCL